MLKMYVTITNLRMPPGSDCIREAHLSNLQALNQSRPTATYLSEALLATFGICFLGTSH